ncbi:MAG: hypothetical protein II625_04325 [Bacilli bacterium]|nr:hypothetical protein [Bacilli bacterium]
MMSSEIYYKFDKLIRKFCQEKHVYITISDDKDYYYFNMYDGDTYTKYKKSCKVFDSSSNREKLLNKILDTMYKKL